MKTYVNMLLIAIMGQLVLGPLNLSLTGRAYAQSAQVCQDMGKVQDPSTGRCVLPEQVVETKIKSNQCEGLSGKAYHECFKTNAEEGVATMEAEEDLKKTDKMSEGKLGRYAIPTVAGLVAGYYLLKNKSKLKQCSSTSMWLILGGAASGMVTEIMAQRGYKKKTKELLEEYEEATTSENHDSLEGAQKATEAQTLALEMMKKQEEARKSAASTREGGHMLATGLYAAAAIAAIYEQVQFAGQTPNCFEKGEDASTSSINLRGLWLDKNFQKNFKEFSYLEEVSVPEFMEMVARKVYANIFVSRAYAQSGGEVISDSEIYEAAGEGMEPDIDFELDTSLSRPDSASAPPPSEAGAGLGDAGGEQAIDDAAKTDFGQSVEKMVQEGLSTPWVRAALAGVLGGYAYHLVGEAKKNKKIADKRIAAIDKLVEDFTDSGGASWNDCSKEERDNPSNPACYCYNDDGTANGVRANRQVCVAYRSDKGMSPGTYGGSGMDGYRPAKICLKDDGKVDQGCQVCKRQPQRCPAIAKATVGSLSFGGQLGMGKLVDQNNALNTGRLSPAELEPASLHRQAARIKEAKKQLVNSSPKYKSAASKADKLAKAFRKAAPGLYRKSFGANPPPLLASNGASSDFKVPKALEGNENVKKALAALSASQATSGAKISPTTRKEDPSFDFGFGDESAGGVVIDDSVAEVMDKEYNIKGDIHKNPSHNIFKILSLRYQRSGLRRLFDSEGKSEADEAAESTINAR